MSEFQKFDGNKLQYDLVPPSLISAVADVLTFGAAKYSAHNWKSVDDPTRYVSAMYRHLEAWRAGEEIDQESGRPHLHHAATNLSFLIELGYNPTDWKKQNEVY